MSREAIEEAIEVLEEKQEPRPCKVGSACVPTENGSCACSQLTPSTNSVVTQTEQEPVAWMYVNYDGECEQIEYGPVFDDPSVTPLYTAPPKKEWVGLTDEDIAEAVSHLYDSQTARNMGLNDDVVTAKAIEARLKEKNT